LLADKPSQRPSWNRSHSSDAKYHMKVLSVWGSCSFATVFNHWSHITDTRCEHFFHHLSQPDFLFPSSQNPLVMCFGFLYFLPSYRCEVHEVIFQYHEQWWLLFCNSMWMKWNKESLFWCLRHPILYLQLVNSTMEVFDTDKDGFLNFSEFSTLMWTSGLELRWWPTSTIGTWNDVKEWRTPNKRFQNKAFFQFMLLSAVYTIPYSFLQQLEFNWFLDFALILRSLMIEDVFIHLWKGSKAWNVETFGLEEFWACQEVRLQPSMLSYHIMTTSSKCEVVEHMPNVAGEQWH
jgi:hypothetical protein